MEPERLTQPERTVVGISTRTCNAWEADPEKARLGAHWGKFFGGGVMARVPGATETSPVCGVYSDYESDHNGQYTHVAGLQVDAAADLPEGLVAVTVPAGEYLVFRGRGEMPAVVVETWEAIWAWFGRPDAPARSYIADCEVFGGAGDAVDIHIGVS